MLRVDACPSLQRKLFRGVSVEIATVASFEVCKGWQVASESRVPNPLI